MRSAQRDDTIEIVDIPVIPEPIARHGERRYPLDQLKPGQGFVLPVLCNRSSVRTCASKYAAQVGAKFGLRNVRGIDCMCRLA